MVPRSPASGAGLFPAVRPPFYQSHLLLGRAHRGEPSLRQCIQIPDLFPENPQARDELLIGHVIVGVDVEVQIGKPDPAAVAAASPRGYGGRG
jgi:hypothetical protein